VAALNAGHDGTMEMGVTDRLLMGMIVEKGVVVVSSKVADGELHSEELKGEVVIRALLSEPPVSFSF
jgi:hypothetical protein